MRLNRFDTSKIRVRSSSAGGGRRRAAGGVGCGTLVIALVAAYALGVDPMQAIAVLEGVEGGAPTQASQGGDLTEEQVCTMGPYAREACNALNSLNDTWRNSTFRSA